MAAFTSYQFVVYDTPVGGVYNIRDATPSDPDGVYTEQGGTIDNQFTVGEVLNANFGGTITYVGHFVYNGNTFIVHDWSGDGANDLRYVESVQGNATLTISDWPSTVDVNNLLGTLAFCFAPGTEIATPSGFSHVENLEIGDFVMTADGRAVPVKWIGRQSIPRGMSMPVKLEPVQIKARALGKGCPHSDLTVSADHGMIVDGMVVNASAMVNGATVNFVPIAELEDDFTYYHVETEDHDAIVANGAEAETFVDVASRASFDNYQEYLDLYGHERIIPAMSLPRVTTRRLLPEPLKAQLGLVETLPDVAVPARRA